MEFNRGHELSLDSIFEELMARPYGTTKDEAMEILIQDRIDRLIFNEADATIVRANWKNYYQIWLVTNHGVTR